MQDRRKIALVGPSFFSYIEAIRQRLVERGIEAEFFDERHANSIRVKILYRTGFYALFGGRKNRHLDELVASMVRGGFTDALLIDVEVCDRRFVEKLTAAGVKVHVYMWDSARNKPRYLSYLHLLHGKSSFDPQDCSQHGLQYIPLFAESVFCAKRQPPRATSDRPVDISFCGTLHSNRAQRLGELMDFAASRRLNVSLLLYFHSRWLLAIKCLLQWSNARFFGITSAKGFSKQQIFELLAASKYVLDLPHPAQAGLTARTFEVLRAGTRLITFNPAAHTLLPPSLSSRVVCIKSADDLASIDFGVAASEPLSDSDDYFLSLDRFTDQVLELMSIRIDASREAAQGSHARAGTPAHVSSR